MSKSFLRIVAFLLVPCLAVDPGISAILSNSLSFRVCPYVAEQALSPLSVETGRAVIDRRLTGRDLHQTLGGFLSVYNLFETEHQLQQIVDIVKRTLGSYGWGAQLLDPDSRLRFNGNWIVLQGAEHRSFDCAKGALALYDELIRRRYSDVKLIYGPATDGILEMFVEVGGHFLTTVPNRRPVDDPELRAQRYPTEENLRAEFKDGVTIGRWAALRTVEEVYTLPLFVIPATRGTGGSLLMGRILYNNENVVLVFDAIPMGRSTPSIDHVTFAYGRDEWAKIHQAALHGTQEAFINRFIDPQKHHLSEFPREVMPTMENIVYAIATKLDFSPESTTPFDVSDDALHDALITTFEPADWLTFEFVREILPKAGRLVTEDIITSVPSPVFMDNPLARRISRFINEWAALRGITTSNGSGSSSKSHPLPPGKKTLRMRNDGEGSELPGIPPSEHGKGEGILDVMAIPYQSADLFVDDMARVFRTFTDQGVAAVRITVNVNVADKEYQVWYPMKKQPKETWADHIPRELRRAFGMRRNPGYPDRFDIYTTAFQNNTSIQDLKSMFKGLPIILNKIDRFAQGTSVQKVLVCERAVVMIISFEADSHEGQPFRRISQIALKRIADITASEASSAEFFSLEQILKLDSLSSLPAAESPPVSLLATPWIRGIQAGFEPERRTEHLTQVLSNYFHNPITSRAFGQRLQNLTAQAARSLLQRTSMDQRTRWECLFLLPNAVDYFEWQACLLDQIGRDLWKLRGASDVHNPIDDQIYGDANMGINWSGFAAGLEWWMRFLNDGPKLLQNEPSLPTNFRGIFDPLLRLPNVETIRINDLVRRAVELCSGTPRNYEGMDIPVPIVVSNEANGLPIIQAVPSRLITILMAVLINAGSAIAQEIVQKGASVRVSTAWKDAQRTRILVTVEDNGTGERNFQFEPALDVLKDHDATLTFDRSDFGHRVTLEITATPSAQELPIGNVWAGSQYLRDAFGHLILVKRSSPKIDLTESGFDIAIEKFTAWMAALGITANGDGNFLLPDANGLNNRLDLLPAFKDHFRFYDAVGVISREDYMRRLAQGELPLAVLGSEFFHDRGFHLFGFSMFPPELVNILKNASLLASRLHAIRQDLGRDPAFDNLADAVESVSTRLAQLVLIGDPRALQEAGPDILSDLVKAALVYRSIWEREILPKIENSPESFGFSKEELHDLSAIAKTIPAYEEESHLTSALFSQFKERLNMSLPTAPPAGAATPQSGVWFPNNKLRSPIGVGLMLVYFGIDWSWLQPFVYWTFLALNFSLLLKLLVPKTIWLRTWNALSLRLLRRWMPWVGTVTAWAFIVPVMHAQQVAPIPPAGVVQTSDSPAVRELSGLLRGLDSDTEDAMHYYFPGPKNEPSDDAPTPDPTRAKGDAFYRSLMALVAHYDAAHVADAMALLYSGLDDEKRVAIQESAKWIFGEESQVPPTWAMRMLDLEREDPYLANGWLDLMTGNSARPYEQLPVSLIDTLITRFAPSLEEDKPRGALYLFEHLGPRGFPTMAAAFEKLPAQRLLALWSMAKIDPVQTAESMARGFSGENSNALDKHSVAFLKLLSVALNQRLDSAPNDAARESILTALDKTMEMAGRGLDSSDPDVVSFAAVALADSPRPKAVQLLTRYLYRLINNVPMLNEALATLSENEYSSFSDTAELAVEPILPYLNEPESFQAVAPLFDRSGSRSAYTNVLFEAYKRRMDDPSTSIRKAFVNMLPKNGPNTVEFARQALDIERNDDVISPLLFRLGRSEEQSAIDPLENFIMDGSRSEMMRQEAVQSLGWLNPNLYDDAAESSERRREVLKRMSLLFWKVQDNTPVRATVLGAMEFCGPQDETASFLLTILESIQDPVLRAATAKPLGGIIDFLERDSPGSARSWFNRLESDFDADPDVTVKRAILEAIRHNGDAGSLELFRQVLLDDKADASLREQALSNLEYNAFGSFREKAGEQALDILRGISAGSIPANLYEKIQNLLKRAGDPGRAAIRSNRLLMAA